MEKAPGFDLSYTENRELSWLKFNGRVLAQAADPDVPLRARLRFLSIFSGNLDEFFMVRVGALIHRDALAPDAVDDKSGMTASQQLDSVCRAVRSLIARRDGIYRALIAELSAAGVTEVDFESLTDGQRAYVDVYFQENLRPLLSPQVVDRGRPFPSLSNKALCAAALLSDHGRALPGIVELPKSAPPILTLPGGRIQFVRTEAVVVAQLPSIFEGYGVEERAVVSITRSADLNTDGEPLDGDRPDRMARLLRRREALPPVRLEVQGHAPRLTRMLAECLQLPPRQVYACACPLKLDDACLPDPHSPGMDYPPCPPVYPKYLRRDLPMAAQVRRRDVLLFYPYQSMQPFLDLLRQSANDPAVTSIRITLYRLARSSAIARALCAAAENGKEVTVLMELRARFDEQNNLDWTRELTESGCRVFHGPEDRKCHAKLCLITRREKDGLSCITQIGTGNYNERTSALYTDFCLMTADAAVARDAALFFENMLIGRLSDDYETLLVAPNAMKGRLMDLIDGEIAKGARGRILIKANAVTERELIDKLSEASCAGVKVDLIVRGICCLVPGVPGRTENIAVTSIVGRFLEHSRVYCFGAGVHCRCYLSSADVMTRNQCRRVEVACPVRSPELRALLLDYLDRALADNAGAWRLQRDGSYRKLTGAPSCSVQRYYIDHPLRLRPGLRGRLPRLFS